MSEPIFEMVDIGRLKESALNPRRRYDEKKIQELAESMKGDAGVIEPLIVRQGKANGALVLVAAHDQETLYREIVNTIDEKQLIKVARVDGLMRWSVSPDIAMVERSSHENRNHVGKSRSCRDLFRPRVCPDAG